MTQAYPTRAPQPSPAPRPAPTFGQAALPEHTALLEPWPQPDSCVPDDSGYLPSDLLPEPAAGPASGHSLVGRYQLQQRLGEGGLGQVHQAWDPLLSRRVAVKTLRFEALPLRRRTLDQLFLNEARAAAGLSHPYIVTVHDAGLSDQGVFIAMECLRGRDLRQALADGWRPEPHRAARLARRVADALAYAHLRGVVHCDIKPANIFLTRHDKPRVLDFGIARVAHRMALPELEGLLLGSPHYMSPEQVLRQGVDARSDVFSLGAVLYELLAGAKAFQGDALADVHLAVVRCQPTPLAHCAPGLDGALAALVHRALSRQPKDRFENGQAFSQALRCWAAQRRASASAPRPAVPTGPQPRRPAAEPATAWPAALLGWMRRVSPAG